MRGARFVTNAAHDPSPLAATSAQSRSPRAEDGDDASLLATLNARRTARTPVRACCSSPGSSGARDTPLNSSLSVRLDGWASISLAPESSRGICPENLACERALSWSRASSTGRRTGQVHRRGRSFSPHGGRDEARSASATRRGHLASERARSSAASTGPAWRLRPPTVATGLAMAMRRADRSAATSSSIAPEVGTSFARLPAPQTSNHSRVIIIEESRDRDAVQYALKREGFVVEVAADGGRASARPSRSNSTSSSSTDVPSMAGWKFARLAPRHSHAHHAPRKVPSRPGAGLDRRDDYERRLSMAG